jgi:hypothetical protein
LIDVLKNLLAGFIGGFCAWFLADFGAKPFRRFFDLRSEVNRCLVQYGNVQARAKWKGDYSQREVTNISPEEDARLTEAQHAFRNLGAEMRAFANVEYFGNRIVRRWGYNADEIASALIAYSNEISTYGKHRFETHKRLETLLRIRAEAS